MYNANNNKVSVVIPTFNTQDTIKEAVDSVINGTYSNIEILIIDDHSTDSTWEIVSKMASEDPRIKCYRNKKNCGASRTRNRGIKQATGKYIAFLDSDDTWEPDKLEVCLKALKENPDIKAIGHAMRYISVKGRKIGYLEGRPITREEMLEFREKATPPWLAPSASAFIAEREVLMKAGGFKEDWRNGTEDMDLYSRLLQQGHDMISLKEPLGNYRLRKDSLVGTNRMCRGFVSSCIRENVLRKRRGERELSLEEYMDAVVNKLPTLEKLNKMRIALGYFYRRKTGESWLNGAPVKAAIFGIIALLLDPKSFIEKAGALLQNFKKR
jgi:glycosyltransferase involved in cell wall biosynthesis